MGDQTGTKTNYEELRNKVIAWGAERGIPKDSTAQLQKKAAEEFSELQAGHGVIDFLRRSRYAFVSFNATELFDALMDEAQVERLDAIGDTLVTLIMYAKAEGINEVECLEAAYNEIKDRKGKVVDGLFKKDEPDKESLARVANNGGA